MLTSPSLSHRPGRTHSRLGAGSALAFLSGVLLFIVAACGGGSTSTTTTRPHTDAKLLIVSPTPNEVTG
ncbi:MAG TPA: hypothetical protein VFV02_09210, partial [Acidimicrobiales bacterium]|nr:hypothetical protein [Acidimicrobiales bacterium]